MKLDDAIKKRRSVRKFSNKKVRWDSVLEAVDAALQAPFAGNINNLQFIIVQDPELIYQLSVCCQQGWVVEAQIVVVVVSDTKHLKKIYDDRGPVYSRQHAGAAIQNFLLKITDLKLGSCWIGAFADDQVRNLLNVPDEKNIEAILPVGYSKDFKKQPKKASLQKSINWDKLGVGKKPTAAKDPKTW